jgi:hypothetical protein
MLGSRHDLDEHRTAPQAAQAWPAVRQKFHFALCKIPKPLLKAVSDSCFNSFKNVGTALWVARPTTEEVDDLLKFRPSTRRNSISNCGESVVERTWARSGLSNGIGRRQRAGDFNLLVRLLLIANALGSRHFCCFRSPLRSRYCLRFRQWISMLADRTARGGVPAFTALVARRPHRPRRPSGGTLLPHRLGGGKASERMPARNRTKHRGRREQQLQTN